MAGTVNYAAMLDPLHRGYASGSADTGQTADSDGHWAQGYTAFHDQHDRWQVYHDKAATAAVFAGSSKASV
ncbi:MAG TPA: hypothetical protein VIY49_07945 [Bryobacteraceae bacterium]